MRTIHGHGFRFVGDIAAAPLAQHSSPAAPAQNNAPNNLRKRRRPLFGRRHEVERVLDELASGDIVSIVGPGGAGKSALAVEVASSVLERYPGGIWFCELAPAESDRIESAVLGVLDSSAGSGPVSPAKIAERLGEEQVLLVLDNCEHVIEAAAALADKLSGLVPNLTILTTSREALDLPTETVLRLGGLPYEARDGVAVEMFLHCARQATDLATTDNLSETVRQITERLEGLPLAIELAAPRLSSRTPDELLQDLDDQLSVLSNRRGRARGRHHTMDDTIAWSFNLLSDDEQNALTSLSIFAGAFTAQAAEAVCETPNARDILHSLVSQSMVNFIPDTPMSRFRLLEPIRQFSEKQLEEERRSRLEERHGEWFASQINDLAQKMRGPDEVTACEALTAAWPDVGRALAWGRRVKRADIAVEPLLALHIHLLWQLRIEGFEWLEAGVQCCDLSAEYHHRADLVRSIGAWSAGDLDRSEALMATSIAAGGETVETAYFQFYQGFAREDFEKVFISGKKAWDLARKNNDIAWKIQTSAFLACGYAMSQGDAPEIPGLFEDIEAMLKDYDWPSGHCCELIGRTVAAFGRGSPEDVEHYRNMLEIAANRCYAPWFKVTAAGIEASLSRPPDEAKVQLEMYAKGLKSAISTGDVIQLPTILRAIAICLVDVGEPASAARLSGLIPSIRGLGEKGSLAPGYEGAMERAVASMTDIDFDNAVSMGQDWDLEDVLSELDVIID
ncbi:NB-ARC domain-containing protein [Cognatiyoonia sp. IB215446]|nr:NB-ARC domain-containing protein [Cognatiyoonia sp. IB215446]MDX8346959.1 NB-ARC domain-containing protein [Cognatiyoonia sp. IB215446]